MVECLKLKELQNEWYHATCKATCTRIRFHAKTETFLFVFAFRPHANAYSAFSKVSVFTGNGDFRKRVWKWRLSKTETFENAALSCGRAKTETFENGVDLKTHTCGGRGLRKSISELIWLPSLKMFGWSERQAFKNLPNLLRHSEMAKYGYATFCLVGYTIYPTAGETDKLKIKSLVWVCSPVAIIVLLLWFSHAMRCAMDHTLKTESSPRKLTLAHRNVICCDCVSG